MALRFPRAPHHSWLLTAAMFSLPLLAAGALAGCEAVRTSPTDDCIGRLLFGGREYRLAPDTAAPAPGPNLGRAEIPRCGDSKAKPITAYRVPGVPPALAVVAEVERKPKLWLGPGYIVEDARHPLHDAVYGRFDRPDRFRGYRCAPSRTLLAVATRTPLYGEPLRVAAVRAPDRAVLAPGDGLVLFDAQSRIAASERHGVPFIKSGDRFVLELRSCEDPDDPGGGPLLVGMRLNADRSP